MSGELCKALVAIATLAGAVVLGALQPATYSEVVAGVFGAAGGMFLARFFDRSPESGGFGRLRPRTDEQITVARERRPTLKEGVKTDGPKKETQ